MCGIYLCALCESLPDCIFDLRTNFSREKLIVKRIFLTIQSHNLKSHKVLKSPKFSNSHNFINKQIYSTMVLEGRGKYDKRCRKLMGGSDREMYGSTKTNALYIVIIILHSTNYKQIK